MEKDNFKSKLGIVAATAGSAVGLGNLWGFSYKAGTNGGGTFVLIYLFAIVFVGLPVMLAEFVIGREGRGGPVGSIENVTKSYTDTYSKWYYDGKDTKKNRKSPFVLAGYSGTISTFLILSFYSVIAGWSISYLVTTLRTGFSSFQTINPAEYFGEVATNVSSGIMYQSIFMLLTVCIVMFGIQNGIEKVSKVMMPILLIIIVLLALYAVTMPGFKEAVNFLFVPSALPEGSTFFSVSAAALGQAFFSLSLGMGAVITYARAVNDDININTVAIQVAVCDTLIALLAGLAIFPIIFSTEGLEVAGGAGLAFMALPVAFSKMPGGYIVGNAFFLLLVIAALTSSISMLENTLTVILEKFKVNRKVATVGLGVATTLFGILSQLGLGYSSKLLSFTGQTDFLDQLDKLTMIYLIPFGALLIVILVGYRMKPDVVRRQINNDKISAVFIPYVKYVAPILVGVIMVAGLLGI